MLSVAVSVCSACAIAEFVISFPIKIGAKVPHTGERDGVGRERESMKCSFIVDSIIRCFIMSFDVGPTDVQAARDCSFCAKKTHGNKLAFFTTHSRGRLHECVCMYKMNSFFPRMRARLVCTRG